MQSHTPQVNVGRETREPAGVIHEAIVIRLALFRLQRRDIHAERAGYYAAQIDRRNLSRWGRRRVATRESSVCWCARACSGMTNRTGAGARVSKTRIARSRTGVEVVDGRCTEHLRHRTAQQQVVNRTPFHLEFAVGGAAKSVVVRVARTDVDIQRFRERRILEYRNQHLGVGLLDVEATLGVWGAQLVCIARRQALRGVERIRVVVGALLAIRTAHRKADRTCWQLKQVAVGTGRSDALCIALLVQATVDDVRLQRCQRCRILRIEDIQTRRHTRLAAGRRQLARCLQLAGVEETEGCLGSEHMAIIQVCIPLPATGTDIAAQAGHHLIGGGGGVVATRPKCQSAEGKACRRCADPVRVIAARRAVGLRSGVGTTDVDTERVDRAVGQHRYAGIAQIHRLRRQNGRGVGLVVPKMEISLDRIVELVVAQGEYRCALLRRLHQVVRLVVEVVIRLAGKTMVVGRIAGLAHGALIQDLGGAARKTIGKALRADCRTRRAQEVALVRRAGGITLDFKVVCIGRKIAASRRDAIELVVVDACSDAALVGRLAEHEIKTCARTVVVIGLAHVGAELHALEVFAQDDVHHAADRIRTVGG